LTAEDPSETSSCSEAREVAQASLDEVGPIFFVVAFLWEATSFESSLCFTCLANRNDRRLHARLRQRFALRRYRLGGAADVDSLFRGDFLVESQICFAYRDCQTYTATGTWGEREQLARSPDLLFAAGSQSRVASMEYGLVPGANLARLAVHGYKAHLDAAVGATNTTSTRPNSKIIRSAVFRIEEPELT